MEKFNTHKYEARVYPDPTDLDLFEIIVVEIRVDDVGVLCFPFTTNKAMKALWPASFHGNIFWNFEDDNLYYLSADENGFSKWSIVDESSLERIYERETVKSLETEQTKEV